MGPRHQRKRVTTGQHRQRTRRMGQRRQQKKNRILLLQPKRGIGAPAIRSRSFARPRKRGIGLRRQCRNRTTGPRRQRKRGTMGLRRQRKRGTTVPRRQLRRGTTGPRHQRKRGTTGPHRQRTRRMGQRRQQKKNRILLLQPKKGIGAPVIRSRSFALPLPSSPFFAPAASRGRAKEGLAYGASAETGRR